MKCDKPQRPKLPQFLYSWVSAFLFTLSHISHFFSFTQSLHLYPLSFSLPLLFSLCATVPLLFSFIFSSQFFQSLNLQTNLPLSRHICSTLHTPHSTALLSHLFVSRHSQATQPRSCHLLTHLRGAQPQIINQGEGKLNYFHHSLKSLNVFSFWIDFLIL